MLILRIPMRISISISLSRKQFKPACRLFAGWFLFLTIHILCSGCGRNEQPPDIKTSVPPAKQSESQASQSVASATLPKNQVRPPAVKPSANSSSGWFADKTTDLQVDFSYSDGSDAGLYQLLESVGGGVLVIDYDLDGWTDVMLTGGGRLVEGTPIQVLGSPSAFFRNQHGETFSAETTATNLDTGSLYTHGGAVSDLNSDGFDDLVVCGYGGVQIWYNSGDGTFTEVSKQLGVKCNQWNVGAATADYDGDGFTDLYVLTYADWTPRADDRCLNDQQLRDICGPTLYEGVRDHLFRSSGEAFTESTAEVGLIAKNRGLGIVAADFNGDSRPDFAIVNDVQENQLYLNQPGKAFEEVASVWGVAYSDTGEREGSMGVDAGDFDRDGLLDLWYTNYAQQDNSLLRNAANTGFLHTASVNGLHGVSRQWVGFGTGFADFDCDGWDDLFVINGHVAYERLDSPYRQPPQLFRNLEGQGFEDVSEDGGSYFSAARSGRGAAMADLNNDGATDLIVSHQNDRVSVLINNHTSDHWIRIQLTGVTAERPATAASVTLFAGGEEHRKWRTSGGSYLAQSDQRMLFSLNSSDPVSAVVTWPTGEQERFEELATRSSHTLIQGRGKNVSP